MTDAFDHGARLYQVASVVAGLFPSLLAWRIASPRSKPSVAPIRSTMGSARSCDTIWVGPKTSNRICNTAYGDIRSAHFHGGEFPLGEFDRNRAFEPFMDPEKAERSMLHRWCYQVTREAIINWIASVVPDVPPDEDGEVGDTGKAGTP